jgi:protein-disulfide isomerase
VASLGYTRGDPDAPLQVIEFSDFACGYCRKFHLETWPALDREYVATGKVQWKYVPMILGMFGPNAEGAAQAGECALEQGRFSAMQDALFENQTDWKRAREPRSLFQGYAEAAGLNVVRWRACVDEEWRAERVDAGTRLSREVGVRGTPTFFVVGYGAIPGAIPADLFRQVLDTAYAARTGGGGP